MAKKINETQMQLSSHSVNELEVCVAVHLTMDDDVAKQKFNDWPYIYMDTNGKLIFNLSAEPPFMPSVKAQELVDNANCAELQKAIDEHFNGLNIKVEEIYPTTELY